VCMDIFSGVVTEWRDRQIARPGELRDASRDKN